MASPTTDRRLGLVGNTAYKAPVTVLSTANLVLSGEQTIDGVALKAVNAAGRPDRVLCTGQTSSVDNGIWDVQTSAWTRSIDSNGNYDFAKGTQVIVARGSAANQIWECTATDPITIGTSAITWSQSLSAGFLATLAASGGSALIGFIQGGASAVARTEQDKSREWVTPLDYGADATGATDSTAAFTAANVYSKSIQMPVGTFKLTNWQPTNGTALRGAGYLATTITQGANGSPAIFINNGNVNWQGLEFSGFTLNGAAVPTVAAFQLTPGASGAIWRSKFDFVAENTYQAFNVTSAGTNFFDNEVHIQSEGTVTTAVYIQSGTYNRFNLFLTNCANSIALDHGGIDDEIWIVTDGQIKSSGLNTKMAPKVENLYGTALAAGEAAISMTGTNQVLINPSVILPLGSATKCTYAFKPSNGTVFLNPYITSSGGATLANPFNVNAGFLWTLVNGQSNCTNKMETIYNDSDNTHSLRYVTMLGDVSQLTASTQTHGGKVTQYTAPTLNFSLNVNGNADAVIVEPSSGLATAQFNLTNGLVDGRVISFTTTQALTAVTWVSAAGTTLMSTTFAANSKASFVYALAQNKFYPV